MRQLVLIGCVGGLALPALAQQPGQPVHHWRGPVVSAGLPTVAGALGVQVEQPLGRHFSLSLWGARFFSAYFPGYQGGLLARYYFRPTAPLGWYLQAQAGAFSHDAQLVSDYPGASSTPYTSKLNGKGGGLAGGYQWALTRHLVANAAVGLRVYTDAWNQRFYDAHYVGQFNYVGQPGSWLDAQLSVGYCF